MLKVQLAQRRERYEVAKRRVGAAGCEVYGDGVLPRRFPMRTLGGRGWPQYIFGYCSNNAMNCEGFVLHHSKLQYLIEVGISIAIHRIA